MDPKKPEPKKVIPVTGSAPVESTARDPKPPVTGTPVVLPAMPEPKKEEPKTAPPNARKEDPKMMLEKDLIVPEMPPPEAKK